VLVVVVDAVEVELVVVVEVVAVVPPVVVERVGGDCGAVTVSVTVFPPPQPASGRPAASTRAANAAGARLMTYRRARAGATHSRGSR
jgi:hypothetical protein